MIRNSIKFGIVLVGGIFIMLHYIIPAERSLNHGRKAICISERTTSVYQSSIGNAQVPGTDSGIGITPQNC